MASGTSTDSVPADELVAESTAPAGDGPDGVPPRLLLLDGHSLAYRAFYALPPENFSTTSGQTTNAVFGFTSMLINALRDEAPTHIAVAFDLSRSTFRSAEYPEYKAGRSKTPDEFGAQLPLIKEVLGALHIPVIVKDQYEADDIIATIATTAERSGFDVLVVSGDRDTFQLVSDQVTVLYPKRGVSEISRMTPAAVVERYGLSPAQYPDYAALRGDPSDNLPNIPGVGEKTAARWVREYGSLAALVDRVDEVKGKAGDALRAALASVMRNRRLTELVRDVEIDVGLDDMRRRAWDRDAVADVFDALQFRVLRERLYATVESAEPEAEEGFELDTVRLTTGELTAWLEQHAPPGARLGLQLTGTWGRGTGRLGGIALATADGSAAWFDPQLLDQADDTAFASWLADPTRPKAMHDAKGPLLAIAAYGWSLAGLVSDTALAAYLLAPDQRSFELADLTVRHLQRDLRVDEVTGAGGTGQLSLDGGDEEDLATGAMIKARAVLDLAEALDAKLTELGGATLLQTVELPLVDVLASMERTGIAVDADYLTELGSEFADQVSAAAIAAYAVIGREVNLGSPKQLQVVLFDELDLPKTKRIKTGYTTDAESLIELAARTDHPFLAHLLRHRDVTRLKAVIDGLLPMIDEVGRIHTTFQQTIAATGRLSSVDPNLQNIPIRTAEGRRIRTAFVVGSGYDALMTADYSQIEMRIMAHLSDDAALLAAFEEGEDLHTTVASRVFEVRPGEVTLEMRAKIKAMSYGLAYGLSAYGLSRQLGISPDEARGLMDEYFERFGGVRDYLREIVEVARREGYTETILGRRRYLPDLTSDNRQRREMAERMALNAPIQGSAADIIKVAMLDIDAALRDEGLRSRLVLQVHDELVLEVAVGERTAVEELVRTRMANAYPLRAKLDVSVGWGRTWQEAAH